MKIARQVPACEFVVTFDGYLPMDAQSIKEHTVPLNRFRTGDFRRSLLEIGVDPLTGAICRITLTSIDGLSRDSEISAEPEVEMNSLPCIDLDQWPKDSTRLDMENTVTAALSNNRLQIRLGEIRKFHSFPFRNGRVCFYEDNNHSIYRIDVLDLSCQEIEALRFAVDG